MALRDIRWPKGTLVLASPSFSMTPETVASIAGLIFLAGFIVVAVWVLRQ